MVADDEDARREFVADATGIERIPIVDRAQWLELRKQDVTASTVAALFGMHPYQTIAGLHAEKHGVEFDQVDPEAEVVRRGLVLETVVAGEVARLRPEWQIERANVYLRDRRLRLGATPDFFILGDPRGRGVLQTKTVGATKYKRDFGEDGTTPPFWMTAQCLTEMHLDGAAFGALGILVLGEFTFKTVVIEVPRHPAAERKITAAVAQFWVTSTAGEVPAIDYERDGALLAVMFPEAEPGKVVDLRSDNRIGELLERRERLGEEMKTSKTELEMIDTELKEKLGDAEGALVRGWRLTFKTIRRKAYEVKATAFRQLRVVREDQPSAT